MRGDNSDMITSFTEQFVEPGHYADYYLDRVSCGKGMESANKRVREGKLAFGTNTVRGDVATKAEHNVGPGAYEYYHLYGCGQCGEKHAAQHSKSALSTLQSTVPRCGYIRNIDTPGAGDYYPEKTERHGYSYSKRGSSAFAGLTPQHGVQLHEGSATGVIVGPNSYDQDHGTIRRMSMEHNPRLPPFGASSVRGDPTTWG